MSSLIARTSSVINRVSAAVPSFGNDAKADITQNTFSGGNPEAADHELPFVPGKYLSGVDTHDDKVFRRNGQHLQKRTIWRASERYLDICEMERLLFKRPDGKMQPTGKWILASHVSHAVRPTISKGRITVTKNDAISPGEARGGRQIGGQTYFDQAIEFLPAVVVGHLGVEKASRKLATVVRYTNRNIVTYDVQMCLLSDTFGCVLSASLLDGAWAVEQRRYILNSATGLGAPAVSSSTRAAIS